MDTSTSLAIATDLLKKAQCNINDLTDICAYSFSEFREQVAEHLSWSETRYLYDQAVQEQKENKLYEANILKRANPQLQRAVHLAITVPYAELRDYEDEFGGRANQYVAPGAVSSMFSPAAYLTELYREARQLHATTSVYNLDKRRPDLQALALSQGNMDSEVSTLSLSNELLLEGIKTKTALESQSGVMEMLSTFRLSGATPYHDAYENVRQVIQLQDPALEQMRAAPDVAGLMSPASLLGINASVSPELFNILTEEVTEENAKELYEKNFGTIDPTLLSTQSYLKKYYNLSDDEVSLFIGMGSGLGQEKYLNNQLITPKIQSDGSIKVYRITREYTVNSSQLNEAGLFLAGEGQYNLTYNFSGAWSSGSVSYLAIRLNNSKEVKRIPGIPQKNTEYSTEIALSADEVSQPFSLYFTRVLSNGSYAHTAAKFTIEEYNQYSFLLKLNKAIRLSRTTGLSPEVLESIVLSVNKELHINAQVLGKVFSVIYYMQNYKIDAETALILCNAAISQRATDNQISQFDRLFNNPPLNGQSFSLDDTKLDFNPGSADEWHKAVLKRAFGVDDIALYRLLQISQRDNKDGSMVNNLENLSSLYRIKLLAEIHQLNIDELDLLLIAINEEKNLFAIQDDVLSALINKLSAVANWLKSRKLTVYQLIIMTTVRYSQTLIPEIQNLLDTVYNGLQDFDASQSDLLQAMSPYIAAILQLPSENIAYSVLFWADKLQPGDGNVTAQKFWQWLQAQHNASLPAPAATQEQVMQYCHCLSQLALIYRFCELTESAFSLFVTQPEVFGFPAGSAPAHDALSLMMLTRFADWINGLGDKASATLTAFVAKTLTAEALADAMSLDANVLTQATMQAKQHNQVTDANAFSSWVSINIILQWVGVSQQLNIAPQGVAVLIALDYIPRIPGSALPTYAQWETSANILTAGLGSQQAASLQASLEELRSAALSTYSIRQVVGADAAIQSRDELYQYLLIDNQVSAAIKTTRIAEAIASVQLYVNRTLENIEDNADSGAVTRQFFIDWDKYNKRYSTWNAVSQLAYYPENYIEPTLRIGQTKMMNALLQQISQSQLNTDIVEDAFMTYLTSFEQMANLQVISAYHDNVNNDQGLTYFIGRSETDAGEYYWRYVDHSKFGEGKFAANAWGEWNKIDCPINPYQGTIRPVMYKSRLYITWLEQKEITKPSGTSNQTITEYRYDLKLSHIRYDGTWNTPITFDVNSKINTLDLDQAKNEAPGLYCAGYQGEDTLLVMFYKRVDSLSTYKSATMQGLYIFTDMSSRDMDVAQSNVYRDNSYIQFDTNGVIRVNNRYAENYEIPSSVNSRKGYDWGNNYLSMVYGGSIPVIRYQASSSTLNVSLSPKLRIIHNGYEGRQRNQCNLMKKYGKLGDKFIVYNNLGINPDHSSKKTLFYPVYQFSGNASGLSQGRLLFFRDTDYSSTVEAWIPDAGRTLSKTNAEIKQDFALDNLNRPDDLKKYIFMVDNRGIATDVKGAQEINTTILSSKVKVTIKAGSTENSFTADQNVSSQPAPSLEEMYYQFNELVIDASTLNFINNTANIDVTFSAIAEDGRQLGSESFSIPVTRKISADTALILNHDENGAQYMQWGVYRVRLNTLFARQLVDRATTGIDTILSMETQNIPEPQLGKGFYVTFKIPPYDPAIHGTARWCILYLKHVVDNNAHIIYSGQFGDTAFTVTLFIPLDDKPLNSDFIAKVYMSYQKSPSDGTWKGPHFTVGDNGNIGINPSSILSDFEDINILNDIHTEPMDFNGANALYFWELFYYTPMLVAQRLLHEQNFDETNHWLKYVWSPSGYIVHGQIQTYKWNVRPLLEDTSWNSDPLDSVDPDAVAQNDPMHYKVSTFMRVLDLLIARGDYAYRQLERDTLNEAKMWYMQALQLLGEKPYLALNNDWDNPRLDKAADLTTQKIYSESLTRLRQTETLSPRTANSLTGLFLPQVNAAMTNYWQTLEQRLYNLRHHLSIDGQPLSLPIFATPVDPKALLSAAVATSQGGSNLPQPSLPLWRFPYILENARSVVGQLIQFGSTLQGIIERQDAEALNALLQNQAAELVLTNISIQDKAIEELDAEKIVLEKSRTGAQSRYDSYSKLYDENINAGEERAMALRAAASGMTTAVQAARLAGAAADLVPNIFGLAAGGSRWGAIAEATGYVMEFSADVMNTEADKISQSEAYRRRREEWEIQRNNAEAELNQIEAQLKSLVIRREAAVLQKGSLQTQQAQTLAQLTFLQRKFSNQALYNWLRGQLATIYFQFYDQAVARCMMAEMAYRWESNNSATNFIKPGAWQGTYAGLLAGENLMLNLAQMEKGYLESSERALEVTRTISLSEFYAEMTEQSFTFTDKVIELVNAGQGNAGTDTNGLKITQKQLQTALKLSDLNMLEDYPTELGETRRIKQISVTLPALIGPYQNIRAILSYGGSTIMPRGCKAIAISHGMNDSGQFQLDFNDVNYLPFEGIPVDDMGTLTLSFPDFSGKQKDLLLSLNDIILHIRYTIRS
ncbi:MAG: toxin [Enterobacteriaceae bacterium]|jgi:hypothetical protein|nr:toxin [Enterobacteriaceae bacterium]